MWRREVYVNDPHGHRRLGQGIDTGFLGRTPSDQVRVVMGVRPKTTLPGGAVACW
jgi:hypothetical protein